MDKIIRRLGLDIGERRIGLALSESGIFASPHGVLHRKSKKQDFARFQHLVSELKINQLVIGVPYSLNSDEPVGPQARRVLRYAEALCQTLQIPCHYHDERYSTVDAQQYLAEAGRKKVPIDAAAAAVILQSFLDSLTSAN
jgi:putative Holliday junction resolvase